MAETKAYREFREAVLAGTTPDGRDTPLVRALAAADYFGRTAEAARAALDGAQAALVKATAQAEAAQAAVTAAVKALEAADTDTDRVRSLADALGVTPGDVQVRAGNASGRGA